MPVPSTIISGLLGPTILVFEPLSDFIISIEKRFFNEASGSVNVFENKLLLQLLQLIHVSKSRFFLWYKMSSKTIDALQNYPRNKLSKKDWSGWASWIKLRNGSIIHFFQFISCHVFYFNITFSIWYYSTLLIFTLVIKTYV